MANSNIQAQIQRPANWLMVIFLMVLAIATGIFKRQQSKILN